MASAAVVHVSSQPEHLAATRVRGEAIGQPHAAVDIVETTLAKARAAGID